MKIIKQYKDENKWKEVSVQEALEVLEGCYKKDTIVPMLKEGATLQTLVSFYKIKTKD